MLRKLATRLRHRPGDRYEGPAAYCDDYSLVSRAGFYALDASGKSVNRHLRLVCVDDAPGDAWDGACHYEVAGRRDPIARQGRPVELAVDLEALSGITPQLKAQVLADPEGLLAWLESEACNLGEQARAVLRDLAEAELG